jgi:hypothetical protein
VLLPVLVSYDGFVFPCQSAQQTGRLKKAAIALCIAMMLLVVWTGLRWNAPPLRLVRTGTEITIDVQTLGEYPTTVNHIRLSDVNHSAVLWEIQGSGQIHNFSLKMGDNPALLDADHGVYRVVTPQGVERFVLRRGTKYRIEIWGGKNLLTKRCATFLFKG